MTTLAPPIPDTLHLSRLSLSPRSRQVAIDLANPYSLHQTLLNAFDTERHGEAREVSGRLLFRIEPGRTYSPLPPVVLVQAFDKANWEAIAGRFPAYFDRSPEQKTVEVNRYHLKPGTSVAFRIRVNPTWNEPVKGGKRGKRRPILDEDKQLDWFRKRILRNGAEVIHAQARHEGMQYIRKSNSAKKAAIVCSFMEGTLRVRDGELLARAVAMGIGSGKAFGFGLLSLAPPR